MSTEFKNINDVIVCHFLGDSFSSDAASECCGELKNQIYAGNYRIALDFTNVDFIDSTGLGVLFSIHKDLKSKGGLAIANITDGVKAVFKLTKMNQVFAITDSLEDAISSLKKG